MAPPDPLWIFGYSSLVWRPAVAFAERRPAYLLGWARRFWQGSTDHRGVPEAPGRVATLVPEPTALCWGVAYRVDEGERDRVLDGLDHRERGGFERLAVEVRLPGPAEPTLEAITYVAAPGNPNYLGPAPSREIAAQIQRSSGPSGSNVEYLLRLEESLVELGAEDSHVSELAALVRRLTPRS